MTDLNQTYTSTIHKMVKKATIKKIYSKYKRKVHIAKHKKFLQMNC